MLRDATGRTTYSYDALDRLAVQRDPAAKVTTFAYDADGRMTLRNLSGSGRFTHSYDKAARPTVLVNPQAQRTTWSYDADSRTTLEELANGVRVSMLYDAASNLARKTNLSSAAAVISRFDYAYNKASVRTRVAEADGGRTSWSYDKAYQLTREFRTSTLAGAAVNTTFSYDCSGNILTEVTPTGRTTSTYDGFNRLLTQKAGAAITTYAYDAHGNRTLKWAGATRTTYVWDDDQRLRGVRAGITPTITFDYNADGLRFSRTDFAGGGTTKYVWNGQLLVAETDAANATKTTYSQSAAAEFGEIVSRRDETAASTGWPLYDALGSVDRVADATQAGPRQAYDAWGKVTVAGDPVLNYVAQPGYYYDQNLGLYYIRQRWYDPTTKRWLSPDPLLSKRGLNLYFFSSNRPTTSIDPRGLDDFDDNYNEAIRRFNPNKRNPFRDLAKAAGRRLDHQRECQNSDQVVGDPIIIGFYGADTPFTFPNLGNFWMMAIGQKVGAWMFTSLDRTGASHKLLQLLATNNNGKYDPCCGDTRQP